MAQQRFVYLTTDEVQIDSVLPTVGYRFNLPENYRDSVYTVSLVYPEYIDMAPSDIEKYNHLSGAALPEIPQPTSTIVFDRKKPAMSISVMPLAFRDGKYKWLVSFMLKIEAEAVSQAKGMQKAPTKVSYAEHSVLASGKWAKIRVSETGIYELTESLIRQAGFSDLNKVKIYGYGGNLQPEAISLAYLSSTDDLHEVKQCIVNGKHLFYAKGPVSWTSAEEVKRTRNFYSTYGYYFITQSDEAPLVVSEQEFRADYRRNAYELYHSLYEKEEYAWYHGGRNLYENNAITANASAKYILKGSRDGDTGKLHVSITGSTALSKTSAQVLLNDSILGNISIDLVDHDKAASANKTFTLKGIKAENKITIKNQGSSDLRLDYVCLTHSEPRKDYDLTTDIFQPEYVHNITNQDHHADAQADMVIIIPTSQKLLPQAQRLADYHAQKDGLRVNIVPADELYNEFSSGTPDGNAYRRYMKMLYDRAETETDMPKYLLLFGDCVWDNRMLCSATRNLNPNDYLLCYESENSTSALKCYVSDIWFGTLDEGEGTNLQANDYIDIAVGRFPVTSSAEAKTAVDKSINYMENQNAGSWQNVLMFMGDDGNENLHMKDVNDVADRIHELYPGYQVKKVMWDAYELVSSATGHTYPDATSVIKQQQNDGALIMNYAGHGSSLQISHEAVLYRQDFEHFTNKNLPLWITVSCDIMPFDNGELTIGETCFLNSKGGAVAFFGTARTVYATYNKRINHAFTQRVLENENGAKYSLGEAHRLAHNYLISSGEDRTENKMQYVLIGDPALKLNLPKLNVVVDEINGVPVKSDAVKQLKAGSKVKISGHIENGEDFRGTINAILRDSEETIVCRLNNSDTDKGSSNPGASTPFEYKDRTKTLFNGNDVIEDGKFTISFVVPMDINYSDASGMINLHATSEDKSVTANGWNEDFIIGGTSEFNSNTDGPSIYCYLNSPSFVNGGDVNSTPYFVAQLTDEDGINVTGSSIGHDLMLIVDGEMAKTYNLNENFSYDFGSCTSGSTYFSLPALTPGQHSLKFRAWDIFNNSSTSELTFNVVNALNPNISNVYCTENPASTETTFVVAHDRMGGNVNVIIEVMDMSGRILWVNSDTSDSGTGTHTVKWDLVQSNGQKLQTGVYLYRARVADSGSEVDSKAKKLIVIR